MPASGTSRTLRDVRLESAKWAKADLCHQSRFMSIAIRRRELRPKHVALLGACEAPLHDAFVGLAGAGKLGTTTACPSITCAAWASSIAWIAAMACSICSSLIALTPPGCSTFISRGTSKAQIFTAGCCLRTFAIAEAPCCLKSVARASRKSLLNDLRVASPFFKASTRLQQVDRLRLDRQSASPGYLPAVNQTRSG